MAEFEENKHPRDGDGKFTNKSGSRQAEYDRTTADIERQTHKWTADRSGRSEIPKAQGFNRPSTKSHLAHANEMGLNEKQYIKAAEEFFNNGVGDVFYSMARKRFYKYDSKAHIVCVVSSSGEIHTYMKVTEKRFSKIIKQDKLEKI